MKTMPIHFAPLQGYTEMPYRNAHARHFGGIDTYHTPFVRIERNAIRSRDLFDVDAAHNAGTHVVPQLIGNDAEQVRPIMELFQKEGYSEVEINMGCPFPLITGKKNGAGILPHPDRVADLLKLTTLYPDIRFSVKMRLGLTEPDECLQIAQLLNDAPLTSITLHPRVGKQQYKGEADLDAFAAFAQVCRHPLIYNGDLTTVEEIQQIAQRFPELAGVMIGRGLLSNPALAWEYQNGTAMSPKEKRKKILLMHLEIWQRYEERIQGGEAQLVDKMKPFWEYLEPLIGHKAWKQIKKASKRSSYLEAVHSI